MKYTKQEVIQFIDEEDVKFIRLAFCDVFGTQKNISILPEELGKAFEYGIAIDAWSIPGFEDDKRSDLFLHPDPATLVVLPWRPEHGRVVRMFCDITWPDGKPFHGDARYILKESVKTAAHADCRFSFGSETEFYLFKRDEKIVSGDRVERAGRLVCQDYLRLFYERTGYRNALTLTA